MPNKIVILGIKIPRAVFSNLLRMNLLLVLVVFCTALGLKFYLQPRALPVTTHGYKGEDYKEGREILGLWEIDISMGRSLLHQGIPLLKVRNNPQTLYHRPRGFFRIFTDITLGVDTGFPLSILRRSIPSYNKHRRYPETKAGQGKFSLEGPQRGPLERRMTEEEKKRWEERPLVGIYHTHTSESYLPDSGRKWTEGEPGGITRIGSELARTLWERYGVAVVHDQTIHDWPVWRLSYVNALQTGEKLVSNFTDLKMLLDIHRDAAEGIDPLECMATIDGEEVARVLIVVGSDKQGLPHPFWRTNLEFAEMFQKKMEIMYPGLSRGIRLREDGRWNQHIHPHALILEIGEVNNTEKQAKATAGRLAHVIYELLKEIDI